MEIKRSERGVYLIYSIKGISKRTPSFRFLKEALVWCKDNNIELWRRL